MIPVIRLDGSSILLNDDLIESIQQAPDTVVSLVTGRTMILRDSPDDILARVIAFRQAVNRSGDSYVQPGEAPHVIGREHLWPRG
jgi:flagellar protein FlbD